MLFCVSQCLLPSNFIADVWQADKDLSGCQKHQMSDRDSGGGELLEDNDKEDNDNEEYDEEEEDNDKEDDDKEDTTMSACKTSIDGASMKKQFPKVEARPRKCRTSMMSLLQ